MRQEDMAVTRETYKKFTKKVTIQKKAFKKDAKGNFVFDKQGNKVKETITITKYKREQELLDLWLELRFYKDISKANEDVLAEDMFQSSRNIRYILEKLIDRGFIKKVNIGQFELVIKR